MKKYPVNQRGVALVVVLLVILSATAIAIISIRIMQNESRMTLAFKYSRQASQIANQVGTVIGQKMSTSDPLEIASEAKRNSIEAAYAAVNSSGSSDAAWESMMSGSTWYYPKEISAYTGLAGSPDDTHKKFGGDLSRPIIQAGSIGNLTLNQNQVAGFSNADAFCSQSVHANSYALVGRSVPIHNASDKSKSYYLLAELSGRVSGYKREMGVFILDPIPCN